MTVLSLIRRILNGDDLSEEEWAAVNKALRFIRQQGEMV